METDSMSEQSPAVAAAINELGTVSLPDNIELLEVAGEGSCSVVFKVRYRGQTLALKVYRPEVVAAYREKHGVNIAVYEMSRNRKFRKVPELLPYSAKPILVFGHDGKQSVSFLQEFIEGVPLTRVAEAAKAVPTSALEAIESIASHADQADLNNLDLGYQDVLVRKVNGRWLPVLHDFNRIIDEQGGRSLMGLFRKSATPNQAHVQGWRKYAQEIAES